MVTGVTWALPRQASFALIEAVRLPIGGDAKMRASEGPMRKLLISFVLFFLGSTLLWPQAKLSTHWEELTAADFRSAIQQSQGTCLLPFGILEKHGPHLPLGTDLLDVRYATLHAVDQEYAVVFPEYYFEIGRASCRERVVIVVVGGAW